MPVMSGAIGEKAELAGAAVYHHQAKRHSALGRRKRHLRKGKACNGKYY